MPIAVLIAMSAAIAEWNAGPPATRSVTMLAPCPPKYYEKVSLEHKPNQVNSVVLRLQPTHDLVPYNTYKSPRSDDFYYICLGWFRYVAVIYEAKCYEYQGAVVVQGTKFLEGQWFPVGPPPGGDDGSDDCSGGSCDTQLLPDPDSPCEDGGGTSGGGGGSGGDDSSSGGSSCTVEHVIIEIHNEETGSWDVWWEGNATVCQ
jgi:hypothetical protein